MVEKHSRSPEKIKAFRMDYLARRESYLQDFKRAWTVLGILCVVLAVFFVMVVNNLSELRMVLGNYVWVGFIGGFLLVVLFWIYLMYPFSKKLDVLRPSIEDQLAFGFSEVLRLIDSYSKTTDDRTLELASRKLAWIERLLANSLNRYVAIFKPEYEIYTSLTRLRKLIRSDYGPNLKSKSAPQLERLSSRFNGIFWKFRSGDFKGLTDYLEEDYKEMRATPDGWMVLCGIASRILREGKYILLITFVGTLGLVFLAIVLVPDNVLGAISGVVALVAIAEIIRRGLVALQDYFSQRETGYEIKKKPKSGK